jgi:hypothetical protein
MPNFIAVNETTKDQWLAGVAQPFPDPPPRDSYDLSMAI